MSDSTRASLSAMATVFAPDQPVLTPAEEPVILFPSDNEQMFRPVVHVVMDASGSNVFRETEVDTRDGRVPGIVAWLRALRTPVKAGEFPGVCMYPFGHAHTHHPRMLPTRLTVDFVDFWTTRQFYGGKFPFDMFVTDVACVEAYLRTFVPSATERRVIVIYTDGDLSGIDGVERFKKAVEQANLSNVARVIFVVPPHTTQRCFDDVSRVWSEVIGKTTNAIKFDVVRLPIIRTQPDEEALLRVLRDAQKPVTATPPGYFALFDKMFVRNGATVAVVASALRQHPQYSELLTALKREITTIMATNPLLFENEHGPLGFVHKLLAKMLRRAGYMDEVSVLKSRCTNPREQQAFQLLLDSARSDESQVQETKENLAGIRIGTAILGGEVNKTGINAALKDGSGCALVALLKGLLQTPPRPCEELCDGIPLVSTDDPEMCLDALSLFFNQFAPDVVLQRSQLFLCLLTLLTTDTKMVPELFAMVMSAVSASSFLMKSLGVNASGAITTPPHLLVPQTTQMVIECLHRHGDRMLNKLTPHLRDVVLTHYTDIERFQTTFDAIHTALQTYSARFSQTVTIDLSGGHPVVQGAIVRIPPFAGEPDPTVPLVGIVLGVTNAMAQVLQLDQEDLTDTSSGAPDTHAVPIQRLVALTPSLFSGSCEQGGGESIALHWVHYFFHMLDDQHLIRCINARLMQMRNDASTSTTSRAENESLIRLMCASSEVVTEEVEAECPLSHAIAYLSAMFGLPDVLASMLRQKRQWGMQDLITALSSRAPPKSIDTTTVSLRGRRVEIHYATHMAPFVEAVRKSLSNRRTFAIPVEFTDFFCQVCQDELTVDGAVWNQHCHHLMCTECHEAMIEAGRPTPGADLQICNYQCPGCNGKMDTPHTRVHEFLATLDGSIPGHHVARFCDEPGCLAVFCGQVSCGGELTQKKCPTCVRTSSQLVFRTCPWCDVGLERTGGCDVVHCPHCAQPSCWGCGFKFGEDGAQVPYDWRCVRKVQGETNVYDALLPMCTDPQDEEEDEDLSWGF